MYPSPLKTFLFGDDTIAIASSGRSVYQHAFGGPHDQKGTSRDDCNGILIHLLHRLDLRDPAIPFSIPGLRWLPFYYCFDFRGNELGYQLVSDDSLVTFFPEDDPNLSTQEMWPDENYPLEFPKSDIAITPQTYDPTNLDDAYAWAGMFGIDKLSSTVRNAVKKRVIDEMPWRFGTNLPKTEKEFEAALSDPFMQGKPNNTCLNPQCPNHSKKGQLETIALMPAEPVKGVHTFGQDGGGVQLIFQMCRMCNTIRVTNQCD